MAPLPPATYGRITAESIYRILSAIVPLYAAVAAGYIAARWKLLSAADSVGINRFVVLFAIPVLSFQFIAGIDFYSISYRLILADTVFKLLVASLLALYCCLRQQVADLNWLITLWMVTSLTNTLIIGVPTLVAMYGPMAMNLIGQVIVGQAVLWYPGLMLLYELRASQKEEQQQKALSDNGEETSLHNAACISVLSSSIDGHTRTPDDGTLKDVAEGLPAATKSWSGKKVVDDPCSVRHDLSASDLCIEVQKEASSEQPGTAPQVESSKRTSNVEMQHTSGQIRPSESSPSPVLQTQLSSQMLLQRQSSLSQRAGTWKRTLRILGRKLRKSFTVHAAILGVVYSLVAYRVGLDFPLLLHNSVKILGDTGIGVSMFCLGMFMGSTAIFPCPLGLSLTIHGLHFIVGPSLMGLISCALGLRGDTLKVAIMQAALPQAIVSFNFAKEYDAYPEVLSTSITFGTLVSFPVALAYYAAMAHV